MAETQHEPPMPLEVRAFWSGTETALEIVEQAETLEDGMRQLREWLYMRAMP